MLRCSLIIATAVSAGTALAGEVHEIVIQDYRYEPPQLKIKAGDTVQWVNQEKRVSHSILFLGAGGFESERIFPGEAWKHNFARAGRYPYTCGPHPEMKGLVEVE